MPKKRVVRGGGANGVKGRSASPLLAGANRHSGRDADTHATYIPDNNCARVNMSHVEKGNICGPPFGVPCFDYGRCRPTSEGGTGVSIYVYDEECTLEDSSLLETASEVENARMLSPIFREAAKELGLLAESYETACIFIHVNNAIKLRDNTPCAVNTPLWRNGANHLMVDLSDNSR